MVGLGDLTPASFAVPQIPVVSPSLGFQPGLGAVTGLGATSGLFPTGNPADWSWGEWLVLGAGGYLAIKLFFDVKTVGSKASKKLKRKPKKKAAPRGGGFGFGTLFGLMLAGGVLYAAYEISSAGAAAADTAPAQ